MNVPAEAKLVFFGNSFVEIKLTIHFSHLKCAIHWLLVYLQSYATMTTVDFRTFLLPQK